MRISLFIILGAICLTGCVSPRQGIRMSQGERQRLSWAVEDWLLDYPHKDWPAEIRRLRPIEVYYHMANVCIVLSRDATTDSGVCVMPTASSNIPGCVHEAGWSYKYLGDRVWEYEWIHAPNMPLEPTVVVPLTLHSVPFESHWPTNPAPTVGH
jgi:hypothetical protein